MKINFEREMLIDDSRAISSNFNRIFIFKTTFASVIVHHVVNQMLKLDLAFLSTYLFLPKDPEQANVDIW